MVAIEVRSVVKKYRVQYESKLLVKDLLLPFLKKRDFKEFLALNNISFSINKGETIGIIGENGSGKSTIFRVLSGVTRPDKGEVVVRGRISPVLELFSGLHHEFTGRENIYLNGSILGLTNKEIDEKFDEITDFAELGDFINVPVKKYSSGMLLRLGFSIAVNVNPDVLLIDEVLAVGDTFFQNKCIERIREFKRLTKTIVLVSHELNLIQQFCDRVIWLKHGEIAAVGNPEDVVRKYLAKI